MFWTKGPDIGATFRGTWDVDSSGPKYHSGTFVGTAANSDGKLITGVSSVLVDLRAEDNAEADDRSPGFFIEPSRGRSGCTAWSSSRAWGVKGPTYLGGVSGQQMLPGILRKH
jgi:hypothetical protein